MRKHRSLPAVLLLLVCLLLGGMLPCLLTAAQDARAAHRLQPLPTGHYVYQGTLSNHVLALSAYLNASPAVQRGKDAPADAPEELWEALQALLPAPDEPAVRATAFSLTPQQYSAQYCYREIVYESNHARLTVFWAEESALPLRLELKTAPDTLASFLAAPEHEFWQLLRRYGALVYPGELADGSSNFSTLIESHSMQVRGTPFTLTVTAMPAQGVLIYKMEVQ